MVLKQNAIPLINVSAGQCLTIVSLPEGVLRAQFIRVGIHEGERVQCLERLPGGTIVLKKKRQHIAIGHQLAKNIYVVLVVGEILHFMKEASGWFFLGALAVGIAQATGILQVLQNLLVPLTTQWLQLPPEAATVFIMGVVRRDFGAAGLYRLPLTPMQITVALITITLFVPCI